MLGFLRPVDPQMSEEAKKEEAAEAPKPKEKPAANQKEEEKDQEKPLKEGKDEEAKPSSPPHLVLFVDLHCVGCAKKIERSIFKCRGVEDVKTNIEKSQVTVKGIVDPQALCTRIQKKTSRNAKVLSQLPPSDNSTEADEELSQVCEMTTVELLVDMHCEACAQHLCKKIMKMRGVEAAEADLRAKKVTVTGTMDGDNLAEYIHRRTGKLARIIPPPPPPEEKNAEEKLPVAYEEEEGDQKPQEQEDADDRSKEEKGARGGEDEKKDEAAAAGTEAMQDEMVKSQAESGYVTEEEMTRKMMMTHWMPPMPMPTYVIERTPPPPQIFSDENPNACCIA